MLLVKCMLPMIDLFRILPVTTVVYIHPMQFINVVKEERYNHRRSQMCCAVTKGTLSRKNVN